MATMMVVDMLLACCGIGPRSIFRVLLLIGGLFTLRRQPLCVCGQSSVS